MFFIKCSELTGKDCDYVAMGETKDEVKEDFYQHGADSPIHKEDYENSSPESRKEFGKKVDSYLSEQE